MKTSKKEGISLEGSDTSNDEESMDAYEAFAKYYDIWHEDYSADIDYYLRLAEGTGGPVLECMSRTGRALIPFAQKGFNITGVDRSPAMLDMCTTRVSFQRLEVQQRINVIPGGHPRLRSAHTVQTGFHTLQRFSTPSRNVRQGGGLEEHSQPPGR